MRIFVGFACALAACQPTAGGNQAQNNQNTTEAKAQSDETVGVTASDDTRRQASYFIDGQQDQTLLDAIREGTENDIKFDGNYSISWVGCGPGCESYWFVDRRTGAVIEAPASPSEDEMTWNIASTPDSDVIKVTFGPRDGSPSDCSSQKFQLVGTHFDEVGARRPEKCPT